MFQIAQTEYWLKQLRRTERKKENTFQARASNTIYDLCGSACLLLKILWVVIRVRDRRQTSVTQADWLDIGKKKKKKWIKQHQHWGGPMAKSTAAAQRVEAGMMEWGMQSSVAPCPSMPRATQLQRRCGRSFFFFFNPSSSCQKRTDFRTLCACKTRSQQLDLPPIPALQRI